MSAPVPAEIFRKLADDLAGMLAQVLESMTEQRPAAWSDAATAFPQDLTPGSAAEPFWWEQPFQIQPQPALWVGAPRSTWEEIGGRTLRAAGLETVETADARSTWLEVLGQALSALARAIGVELGQEVTCAGGVEAPAPADAPNWVQITLGFGDDAYCLWMSAAPWLLERLSAGGIGRDRELVRGRAISRE